MPIDRHIEVGGFHYICPYYAELLLGANPNGRLPMDREAHALWHYFCVGSLAHRMAKENIVEERDPSRIFNAPAVFKAIAHQHQVDPNKMQQYWPLMMQQRIALGLSADEDLPLEMKLVGGNTH